MLVRHESPSRDKAGARRAGVRDRRAVCAPLGADVEPDRQHDGRRPRLLASRIGGRLRREAALLLIVGHFDTVWPVGTLAARPFRVDDGRAYGPGTFDMKASLVLVEQALKALHILDLDTPRPVVALITSDEEIGSPTSRRLIEEQARQSAYVLVLEPPLPGGGLKTARKGVGKFTLNIEGRAAHAGIEPEKGVSAVLELAHQVLAVHALSKPEAGTTVNVGVVQGGTTSNVVPAHGVAQIDVRATTLDEARRIEHALAARSEPMTPGSARVQVTGVFNRPPMEAHARRRGLVRSALSVIGRSLGLELTEGSTGGASDGNFTAALGVPTLTALGVRAAGRPCRGRARHHRVPP